MLLIARSTKMMGKFHSRLLCFSNIVFSKRNGLLYNLSIYLIYKYKYKNINHSSFQLYKYSSSGLECSTTPPGTFCLVKGIVHGVLNATTLEVKIMIQSKSKWLMIDISVNLHPSSISFSIYLSASLSIYKYICHPLSIFFSWYIFLLSVALY